MIAHNDSITSIPESKTVDIEAEKWVLACALLATDVIDDVIEILSNADDFYDEVHSLLWSHILAIHESGKAIHTTALHGRLKDAGELERVGGLAYLGKLIDQDIFPSHRKAYAERVRNAAAARRLSEACEATLRDIDDNAGSVEDLVGKAEQRLFDISSALHQHKESKKPSFKEMLFQTIERLDSNEASLGVQTGFYEVDKMTGGFRPGEVIVLAARPGVGKTSLALNMAANMAKDGRKVLIVSLEMSQAELTERLLGSAARVPLHMMRNGTLSKDDRKKVLEAAGRISQYPLFIDDSASRTMSQVSSMARLTARRNKGLDIIFIDYMQLITPDNQKDQRQEQVAKISRRIKTLARDLKVPVVAMAQLNRQADDPSRPPRLSQLRESGAIEQDADCVMFIHKPPQNAPVGGAPEETEFHIEKQRNGPTGVIKTLWFRGHCRFENVVEEWKEQRYAEFDRADPGLF